MKNNFIQNLRYLLLIIIVIILFFLAINNYVVNFSKNYIKTVDELEKTKVWLVLGAGIRYNKEPTDILKDRLKVAFEAYNKWKIKKIIVSGDNSKVYHNEPDVMKKYLVWLGVKENDIYPDYAWFDTYDSIYRAKAIFWVNSLVIFTQEYHLYRAIYIAKKLWLKAYWVSTNLHKYLAETDFKARELLARIKAFFEVELFKPKPKFLGEKIEIK